MTPVKQNVSSAVIPVTVYAVCAPGVDPDTVNLSPELVKLGWKFGQMSDADLIDQSKRVDDYLKALEKWVEGARGVLKQRLPEPADAGSETVTPGRYFEAHYVKSTRTALDQERVKTHFGADLPNWCKTTPVLTLKIVPIAQTPGAAG